MINYGLDEPHQTKRFIEGVVRAAIGIIVLGVALLYFLETRFYAVQRQPPAVPGMFGAKGERPGRALPGRLP